MPVNFFLACLAFERLHYTSAETVIKNAFPGEDEHMQKHLLEKYNRFALKWEFMQSLDFEYQAKWSAYLNSLISDKSSDYNPAMTPEMLRLLKRRPQKEQPK